MDVREECLDQSSQHQTGRMMQPFLVGTHRYTQAGADLPPGCPARVLPTAWLCTACSHRLSTCSDTSFSGPVLKNVNKSQSIQSSDHDTAMTRSWYSVPPTISVEAALTLGSSLGCVVMASGTMRAATWYRVRVEITGSIMIRTGWDSPTFLYFCDPVISTRTRTHLLGGKQPHLHDHVGYPLPRAQGALRRGRGVRVTDARQQRRHHPLHTLTPIRTRSSD
jgi:hypothetical protein